MTNPIALRELASRRRLSAGIICIILLVAASPVTAQFAFAPPAIYSLQGTQPATALVTADLNRDGFPDVVVATNDQVQVFLNRGDGTLAPPTVYSVSPGSAALNTVVAVDFNGDGLPDLAFDGHTGFGVMLNRGDGTFDAPTYYATGTGLFNVSVVAADFFHDGRNSVAVVDVGSFGCCPTLTVFRNQGNGTFVTVIQRPLTSGGNFIIAADVNNDGFPDLILTGNGDPGTVSVLLNTRNGDFAAAVDFPAPSTHRVFAADLNNDGYVDLILYASEAFRFGVLLNRGNGLFAPALLTPYFPFTPVYDLAVDDFDGDGFDDIASSHGGTTDRVAPISIMHGNGDGMFGDPVAVDLQLPGYPAGPMASADMDGDGTKDILMADSSTLPNAPSRILVLLNHTHAGSAFFLSTDHGGNAGSITVTVFGGGIPLNSTLKLSCPGPTDIVGTSASVSSDGKRLTATFNLVGTVPSQCHVVITKPDGSNTMVSQPFTIEQGGAPDIWVDVLGRNTIRGGQQQIFSIVIGNRGNVDGTAAAVWVKLPKFLAWSTDPSHQPSVVAESGDDIVLFYDIVGAFSAGSTQYIPLVLTAPDAPQFGHARFTIEVGGGS